MLDLAYRPVEGLSHAVHDPDRTTLIYIWIRLIIWTLSGQKLALHLGAVQSRSRSCPFML